MTENQKNVVVILGSPRKNGNSTTLATEIIKGAESNGANVETFYINGLKITPCQGCYYCQEEGNETCRIDDDMQRLYPKLIGAEAWVIASPVYWFTMTAQTKLFMDRCLAIWSGAPDGNHIKGKKIAIAMSFGGSDPFTSGCVNALRAFQDVYAFAGARIVGTVYGSASATGEIDSNMAVMEQALKLGKRLVR